MQVYGIRYFLLIFFLLTGGAVLAQGIQTEFGKNRVQYSRDFDEWLQYESQNFITYWYGEGRMVGQAAVMIAEEEHDEIQQLLEHRMNDKIEILVYTDLTDLKQSNIGTEEAFTNVTGKTKIYGNKIFVYFNGDHQHFRKQIREGIAEVYLDAMLFGGNLQEYVQNAILFNMPVWFKEGLIAYIGEEWNTDADDRLRTLLQQERFKTFDDVVKFGIPGLKKRNVKTAIATVRLVVLEIFAGIGKQRQNAGMTAPGYGDDTFVFDIEV